MDKPTRKQCLDALVEIYNWTSSDGKEWHTCSGEAPADIQHVHQLAKAVLDKGEISRWFALEADTEISRLQARVERLEMELGVLIVHIQKAGIDRGLIKAPKNSMWERVMREARAVLKEGEKVC